MDLELSSRELIFSMSHPALCSRIHPSFQKDVNGITFLTGSGKVSEGLYGTKWISEKFKTLILNLREDLLDQKDHF